MIVRSFIESKTGGSLARSGNVAVIPYHILGQNRRVNSMNIEEVAEAIRETVSELAVTADVVVVDCGGWKKIEVRF